MYYMRLACVAHRKYLQAVNCVKMHLILMYADGLQRRLQQKKMELLKRRQMASSCFFSLGAFVAI